MSGIDSINTSEVTSAIDTAGGLSTLMEGQHGLEPATPSQGQSEQTSTTPNEPLRDPVSGRFIGQQPETQATDETPEPFTTVDPSTLPAELQPIYKSLQADYTRKTQAVAEERKRFEQFGDPTQLEQAVTLYQTLSNPESWPALYEELRSGMEAMGMSPREAAAAAKTEVERQQAHTQTSGYGPDPEVEEFQQMLSPLQKELQDLRNEIKQREERENNERFQQALIGEIQRQEHLIRQENPNYDQADIDGIYAIAPSFNGNLLEAQKKYEDLVQSRLLRFIEQKSAPNAGGALPGGSLTTSVPEEGFASLDDAHKAAMERINALEAAEL